MEAIACKGQFECTSNDSMRYRILTSLYFEQKALLSRNELITISFDEWVLWDHPFSNLDHD